MPDRGPDPDDVAGDLDARFAAAAERLGHAARLLLRATAARHGLSIMQAKILLRLARDVEGAEGVTSMARWFDVRQPTLSDAVSALERKRLITRGRRGRSRPLILTPAGASAADDLAHWDEPLRDALRTQPREARGAALELLLQAIAGLHRAGVVTIARSCTTCRFFRPATGAGAQHRCALLRLTLQPTDLRFDCPEHEPATVAAAGPDGAARRE